MVRSVILFAFLFGILGCTKSNPSTKDNPTLPDATATGVDTSEATDSENEVPEDTPVPLPDATVEPEDTLSVDILIPEPDVVVEEEPIELPQDWTPASAVLRRLTQSQYRNAIQDVFGPEVVLPSSLAPDMRNNGLIAIGTSVSGLSPVGSEKYFAAAQSIGKQTVNVLSIWNALVPCQPAEGESAEGCLTQVAQELGYRLWRRPLQPDEVDPMVAVALEAVDTLDGFPSGVQTLVTTLLTSPHFIYLVTPSQETESSGLEYTDFAMASRLSFFLWNTGPDAALLEAAAAGELTTNDGLEAQIDRLLADPRAQQGMRAFFSDWLELEALDNLVKDPNVFEHFSSKLGEDAKEETLRVMEHLIFEQEADITELYTTSTTFVNSRLAAIYQIPSPTVEGFGQVELPPQQERAGLLGHVGFLAVHASPTRPSPTLRGVFVREKLLCQPMPPPPANVDTTIPETSLDKPTMKEILEYHMKEPTCAGCHAMVDPIGLGLERFDGIGSYRLLENDVNIDPSGELDGEYFADAKGLGKAIANHPKASSCIARTLWAYANGRTQQTEEITFVKYLEAVFKAGGNKVLPFLKVIAMSEGFRTLSEEESP